MKKEFFESVTQYGVDDIDRLIAEGEIDQALMALEYWRFQGKWDLVATAVLTHRQQLPEVCELYLAEHDALESADFNSDHIPVANTTLCQSVIDTLAAPNRYYFPGPWNPCTNTQKRRVQIRQFREKAPDRNVLWDVLYAKTLKVRSKRDSDRVLELCRPAIKAGDNGLEEYELCGAALTIVFNAARSARDIPTLQKALSNLLQRDDLRANDYSAATFINLRVSENPSYDASKNDTLGSTSTITHLSRIYRGLCRGEELTGMLGDFSEQLCHRHFRRPMAEARLSVDLSPLTYYPDATLDEDHLCDLIRIHQGPLKDLDPIGQRVAAMCHAVGGVASVGLGDGETNKDIRNLTASMDTFWAYRGLAFRILRSEQDHLIPRALDFLSQAYQKTDWSPQKGDPLHLWIYGTEPLVDRIENVLSWAMKHEDRRSFNQALEDIILPTVSELPDEEDDEAPDAYSDKAKELYVALSQSPLIAPTSEALETLYLGFSSMGISTQAVQTIEVWFERWGSEEPLQRKLAFILIDSAEDLLPTRQAIEFLEARRTVFEDEAHQAKFQEAIDDLQAKLDERPSAKHFMLFNPALPSEERVELADVTPRELLQLGAVCAFLEAPTGQALVPYEMSSGPLTIEPDGWPPMLKNLMQHQLLQIRPDGPEGSYELENGGTLKWYPDKVELAVNVHVEGVAGQSQGGILMTLPALIRQQVLSMSVSELLALWRSLVRGEAHEYFLRCLHHFELPSEPAKGDAEVFQSVSESFSLEQLLNLIYNSCRSGTGEQKAQRLRLAHARNLARKMLVNRMKLAKENTWDIKSGFRGDMMPTPYLVEYFSTVFLPLGESVYEQNKPNIPAIEDALLTLRTRT